MRSRTSLAATARHPGTANGTLLARRISTAVRSGCGESSPQFRALEAAVRAHAADLRALGVRRDDAAPRLDPVAARRYTRDPAELALLTPLALAGVAINAPAALAATLAGRLVRDDGWQATTKVAVAILFSPIVLGAEAAVVGRARGRRWALAVPAIAPIGGYAWIAWRTRWLRLRHARWRERIATENGPFQAAMSSRAEVRRLADELVAIPAPST